MTRKAAARLLIAFGIATVSGAPNAMAASDSETRVCTGVATWQVQLNLVGPSWADVTYPTVSCTVRHVEYDVNGTAAATYPTTETAQSWTTRVDLIGFVGSVAGSPVFSGVASTSTGRNGVAALANGNLTASYRSVALDTDDVAEVEHVPAGTCGSTCYRTNVTMVIQDDPLS